MKLEAIAKALNLELVTSIGDLSGDVTGAYVSDLLSDVIANANAGDLWLTLQGHPNVVAVASLKDLSGIVLVNNRQPEEETLTKANEEGIPTFSSPRPAFELAGELYNLMKDK